MALNQLIDWINPDSNEFNSSCSGIGGCSGCSGSSQQEGNSSCSGGSNNSSCSGGSSCSGDNQEEISEPIENEWLPEMEEPEIPLDLDEL